MAFEIVVLGQDACADELLLQSGDVVQQVLGGAASDVVNSVGRQRETVFSGLLLRCAFHDADNTLDDVVDIGEVPLAVAVVEDLDGLACLQFLCGGEVEHVRPACGPVNSEEAETCGRNIVELAVAVRQELIGLFSGRVEGDRVIDLVFNCEGHFFVAAVYGRAGGVDQVLDAFIGVVIVFVSHVLICDYFVVGVTAGFENVVESDQVAFDIDVRVIDGVADAGLRSQIHYDRRPVCREHFVDEGLVSDAASDENVLDWRIDRVDHAETVFFELRIVVIVHVVEIDHSAAFEFAAQAYDEVGAYKAGRACDQDGSAIKIDGSFAHFSVLLSELQGRPWFLPYSPS